MQAIATQIQEQISTLKASTDFNAYSGLLVDDQNNQVVVYDDYTKAVLPDPEATLKALQNLDPINWDDYDNTDLAFEPIWDVITMTGGYES